MLLSTLYAVVRILLGLLLARMSPGRAQAVELLALRHEVRVLRRQVKRTHWLTADRLLLAALRLSAPRAEWWRLPVRPETLLRWHRDLVRRKWAIFGCRRPPGRQCRSITDKPSSPLGQSGGRAGYLRARRRGRRPNATERGSGSGCNRRRGTAKSPPGHIPEKRAPPIAPWT